MRKLILHIGCEKTGSTSIQNFFHANRQRLIDSYGILYPKTLGGRNHTRVGIYACNEDKDLGRFLPKGKNLSEFRESLEQEFRREVMASPAPTIIVSNEWLHPRIQETEEFERLKKLFGGLFDEIRVILYIRRQDKLALSLYSTALKAGNTRKFSFPPGSPDNLPYYYDFYGIYKNWAAQFGEENIIVKVFERDRLTGGDVVKDFLSTLGISGDDFYYPPEENLSLSNAGIKVMRAFNRISGRLDHLLSAKIVRKIRGVISKSFQGKPKLASDAECQEFFELFSESNSLLKFRLEDRFKKTFELFKDQRNSDATSSQGKSR